MFVDYKKCVQQAISSPAAFHPQAHTTQSYTPSIEKGRPVLQGLLAVEFLAKESVLGKQSYMLIGRHDIEKLMRRDPASAFEMEMSDLLLNFRPIKQENLIRDDNKLI